jgi:arylsulfatase A-like enzyme
LNKKGTVFTQAISTTSTTTPSVASILTGTYPQKHGILSLGGYKLSDTVNTWGEIFKKNGYNTYAQVTGPLVPEIGLSRGFDEYTCREKSETVHSHWGKELVRKFENKEFKEPWFTLIHFWELHLPRTVPKEFDTDDYGKSKYDRALSALDQYLCEILTHIDNEDVVVLHADHGEKILEGGLEKLHFKIDRTAWWLLRKAGFRKKKNLRLIGHGYHIYDYLIRVPLAFVCKSIFPEGRLVKSQISQVDILPTLVDALGLQTNENFNPDGMSVMALVKGDIMKNRPTFCEACGRALPDKRRWLSGIRTSKFKFVYSPFNDKIKEELYDLINDPHETANIVDKQPEVANLLRSALEEHRRSYHEKRVRTRVKQLKASGKL